MIAETSLFARPTPSRAKELREKVYREIERHGAYGCTSDEAEVALGMPHQTVSGRFTELASEKYGARIEKAGEKRRTRTGCQAFAWRVRA